MATSAPDITSLIDVASAPDPIQSQPAAEPVVEETQLEETPETEASPEGEGAPEAGAEEQPVDGRTNPAAVRSALKAFRDLDPKNAPIARELNNAYGRYSAYKQVFPKVADAQSAKAILDAVGGNDGIAGLQQTIKSVNETDQLLYAGDPKVLDSLFDDMKAAGKEDAFGKLASPFLDKLFKSNPDAYYEAVKPHFFRGIADSGFAPTVKALIQKLSAATPDVAGAKDILAGMEGWFDKLRNEVETGDKSKLDPERQAFEQERTKFQTERQTAFKNEVNTDWNAANNRALGEALKPFLKLPFAKNWTQATKVSIAREITSTLMEELTADKAYQSQMDAFWSKSQPNKKEIVDFHNAKLGIVSKGLVKRVLEARYPGFEKSRAPMAPKGQPVLAQSGSAGPAKPIFQANKPNQADIDWNRDPDTMLYITGRYYDKRGQLRTWNPKYK